MRKINKPIIDTEATAGNIKAHRIRAGYSVRQAQNILGLSSPQAIYNWESGKDIPTIDNMVAVAALYGVTINDIVATKFVEVECYAEAEALKSA